MAKKERDVTLTIQIRTKASIRDLRKATGVRLYQGPGHDRLVQAEWMRGAEGECMVQIQANEITKG